MFRLAAIGWLGLGLCVAGCTTPAPRPATVASVVPAPSVQRPAPPATPPSTPGEPTPTESDVDETEPAAAPAEPPVDEAPASETPDPARPLGVENGFATWYGDDWHGKPTASGERFNKHKLTAAHRSLPLGAKVRVTNTRNGRWVEVRINDRGPYGRRRERIIDLAEAAAKRLDFINAGVCPVRIEVLSLPPPKAKRHSKKKKAKAKHGA